MGYGTNHENSLAWRRYLDDGWRNWALPLHSDDALVYTFVHLMERGEEWRPAIDALVEEIWRRPTLIVDRMPS